MARAPVRLRAAALTGIVLVLAAGCTGTAGQDAATAGADPTSGDDSESSTADTGSMQTGGQVGTEAADYVDPEQNGTPVPTPEPTGQGLDDPTRYGLTAADEAAALVVAADFVNTIWTWEFTDDSDRAGLIRALPMTTEQLREQLHPFLENPLYEPDEWAQLSAAGQVGSASEVLTARPAPQGSFDADTYTTQIIYRTFTLIPEGYFVARDEEARYATLELTKDTDGTWLISAIPFLDAEQVIESDRS